MPRKDSENAVVYYSLKVVWMLCQANVAFFGMVYIINTILTFTDYSTSQFEKSYRVVCAGAAIGNAISLWRMLDGSVPRINVLLTFHTFQHLIVALVWLFTSERMLKLVPFTAYSTLHLIDALTLMAPIASTTKDQIQAFLNSIDKNLHRGLVSIGFVLALQLLLSSFLLRFDDIVSLSTLVGFIQLRVLYPSPERAILLETVDLIDDKIRTEKTPGIVLDIWCQVSGKIRNRASLADDRIKKEQKKQ